MKHRAPLALLATAALVAVAACSKGPSIEGQYNMTKGPVQGVVATFGKATFTLSTGASGAYEISNGSAILTGTTFAGAFKIDGDKLIGPGDRFEFERRKPDDASPITAGGFSGTKMPSINAEKSAGKSY